MIDEGDILSIHYRTSLQGPKSMSKLDGLSLIFIGFYVLALTPRLSSTETSLQLSENITNSLWGLAHICKCHSRDLDRHQVFGAYHLYIDGTLWHPCLYIQGILLL
jgi:hypothetical protein